MNYISVCKNVIASNNKRNWENPDPAIRVSKTKHGKVVHRSNNIGITDSRGNIVARIVATEDGQPIIGCGAKVAVLTEYDIKELTNE